MDCLSNGGGFIVAPDLSRDGTTCAVTASTLSRCLVSCLLALCTFGTHAQTPLVNGGSVSDVIAFSGDEASFTFTANAGDGVQIRAVETAGVSFVPRLSLFRPDGFNIAASFGDTVAALTYAVTQDGVHTVLVSDGSQLGDQVGAFTVHFTRAPGANEGGVLPNGGEVVGFIDVGDLDSYTFDASAGDGIQIRVSDIDTDVWVPQVHVYRPDGFRILAPFGDDVALLVYSATITGTHTIVVTDTSINRDQSGTYRIYYTRAPGANADGALVNGGVRAGQIDQGDLDSFTFEAQPGDGVQLRIADTGPGDFVPAFSIYRPDGFRILAPSGADVAAAVYDITLGGTHTVVVADGSAEGNQRGDYNLYYTNVPGANENGLLINGGVRTGTIDLGDLDSYTFEAQKGDGLQIRLSDTDNSAFFPQMHLYRPDGFRILAPSADNVAGIIYAITQAGTHTLVVNDASIGLAQTGNYALDFTLAPGANEFGQLGDGDVATEQLDLGDLDSYTFAAIAGEVISVIVTDTSAGSLVPQVSLYRPDGFRILASSNDNVATLDYAITQTGTHTVVVGDSSIGLSQTGSYTLEYLVNVAVPDADGDLIADAADNCQLVSNADQRDTNADGFGNVCDPDLDNNGVVNFADISQFVPEFGTVNMGDPDFNGDGVVNFIDYVLFANFFLQPPGPSGIVP